jgi:hypothetical protein
METESSCRLADYSKGSLRMLCGDVTVPEKFAFPKSKNSKALKFNPVSTNNVHDDIGTPSYDSDLFFSSGLKLMYFQ